MKRREKRERERERGEKKKHGKTEYRRSKKMALGFYISFYDCQCGRCFTPVKTKPIIAATER